MFDKEKRSKRAELANSIENTIAIAFLSTIAIAIAIDKEIFQLLLLLLLLVRASSLDWHFNRNYCFKVLPIIWSEMLFSSLKIHFLVPDAFQIA